MKHMLLSPGIDMVSTIGDIILKDPGTLKDHIVVFPGKRPIHFLRKYLADKLQTSYLPPYVFSMDGFIDYLYEDHFHHTEPKMAEIDCIPILFALNNSENLVADQGVPLSLDDFMCWGFKIYSDFEELCIEQIEVGRLKQVENIAGEKIPPRIQKQVMKLSLLYQQFYKTIGSTGLSTRSSRYRTVAKDIEKFDLAPYKSLVLAGFFALTSSERALFRGLLKHDKTMLLLQKGPHIDRLIRSLNIDVTEKGDAKDPDIQMHKAADVHGEVMQLGRLLRDADMIDQRSAIVLPKADTLFPTIQQALGFTRSAYNISMGYPLFRTPLFSLLDSIGQLLESRVDEMYYVPDYLKVVLHPYIKNILMQLSNEPTRIIFHTIKERLIDNRYRLISLEEIVWNKTILEGCRTRLIKSTRNAITTDDIQAHIQRIHRTCIQVFERITSIHDFCEKLMALLSFLSKSSTANKHPYTNPYIETMLHALYDLKTSALGHEAFKSINGYFRLFRNYVRRIRYPFIGTPVEGLQVLGSLETRNLKFDRVYILDANEGILPNIKKEDTLMPLQVRKYLDLPTHEDRELISRYYFETLLRGSIQAHILYCDSEDKEKSRFVERLIWQEQKENRDADLKTNDVFFAVTFKQKNPKEIVKTAAMLEVVKSSIRYSATYLNAYLKCPLRFYYQRVHNLASVQPMTTERDAYDRGSVVHSILEEFFLHKVGKTLAIGEDDYTNMGHIVAAQFDLAFPHSDQGAMFLFKHQVQRRMKDVLDFYAQPEFQNTIVLECENQTSPGVKTQFWQALYTAPYTTRKGNSVTVSGKIDRVDKRYSEVMILDYKTGSSVEVPKKTFDPGDRSNWYRTLCSVQLPLYILLYQGNAPGSRIESINCGLVVLGSRSIKEVYLFPSTLNQAIRKQRFEQYESAISTLIDEILEPDLPFKPTNDPEKICPGCEYQVICGTQHLVQTGY